MTTMRMINILNQGGLKAIGIILLSTAALTGLKLAGIDWSWWEVTLPLTLPAGIVLMTVLFSGWSWLCKLGIHSWKLLEERQGQRWNEYSVLLVCRRCGLARTERRDMTDQMK